MGRGGNKVKALEGAILPLDGLGLVWRCSLGEERVCLGQECGT